MDKIIEKHSMIGKRVTKLDAPDKAVARTRYINDMVLPRMLYGKILRTDRVHARILSIDTSAAEALPGVQAVITAKDTPGGKIGVLRDNPPLKGDVVRCIRDEIAAVAAETEELCDEAIRLIKVEYEDLPTVFDCTSALANGAPIIHEDRPDNIAMEQNFEHGDMAEGEAQSDFVVEGAYNVHYVTHCNMGVSCTVADYDTDGRVTIYTQTQYPFNVKMDIAPSLGVHPGDVRIIQPPVGGAFGSKLDVYPYEPICVFLAKKTRRPVKLIYSREEEFIASPTRQPVEFKIRAGMKKDGTLTFRDCDSLLNNGGYTSWGATTPYVTMRTMTSHYTVPNVRYRARAVYTNNPFAGSFRGYGNVQATWALETHMDKMAEKIGMDPIAFRLKNANPPNQITPQGSNLGCIDLVGCIEQAAAKSDFLAKWHANNKAWAEPGRFKRGIGIATSLHNAGGAKIHKSDGCGTMLKMDDYARVTIITGGSEIGQGLDTVLAQLVAEELGVPMRDITIINNDSALRPWDVGVHASRTTYIAGNSAVRVARKARDQILRAAAAHTNMLPDMLDLRQGHVVQAETGLALMPLDRILRQMHFAGAEAELVMATDYYEPPSEPEDANHMGDMSAAYSHAAHVAEIVVDTRLGTIKVEKIWSAQDVGRVINPVGLEGQIEGGIAMGLGYGLSEELKIVEGKVLNPSFRDYHVMTAPEMPELDLTFIETGDAEGPAGAKGIAELPTIVIAPAIGNALYNATGVRIDHPPLTPEKVARAIAAHKGLLG
ncbi:MAG: xanthine dehydrogenase family protein molybdopterin-binding subunit [Rhodobacteraceae bacterium]|nr:xanthine dehydrogenase family protein molybdopterin-binding subunit [Paracoccaceae bacterium]